MHLETHDIEGNLMPAPLTPLLDANIYVTSGAASAFGRRSARFHGELKTRLRWPITYRPSVDSLYHTE